MFDLNDKVCLVTGGSRSLGREMVHPFAERGADAIAASRMLENCESDASSSTTGATLRVDGGTP